MSSRLPSRAFSVLEAAVAVDVDVQPDTEDNQHEDERAEFEHHPAFADGASHHDTAAEADD